MTKPAVSKENIRKHLQDGREFVLRYEFEPQANPETYLIRAHLGEIQGENRRLEPTSFIELRCPYKDLSEKLYDFISDAREPVFPIHLPDIVRDQISCTLLDTFRFTFKTSL